MRRFKSASDIIHQTLKYLRREAMLVSGCFSFLNLSRFSLRGPVTPDFVIPDYKSKETTGYKWKFPKT